MTPDSAKLRPSSRILALDLLRVLAVLLVIGRHLDEAPAEGTWTTRTFFGLWREGGWIGVDLFFVLSGFLVSGLLFAEYQRAGRIAPWRFYVRRGFKIYPSFYLFLAVTVGADIVLDLGRLDHGPRPVLAEAFFVQNYFPRVWSHTWSLAVEEHFYLALPVVLLLLLRFGRAEAPLAWLPAAVGGGCVLVLGLRLEQAARLDFAPATHMFPTHIRLDALLFGVLIAYFWHFHPERLRALLHSWRHGLLLLGALLLAPAFLVSIEVPWVYTVGMTLFYLGAGALLVGALLCETPVNALTCFLGFLGAQSYSVYLWHLAVLRWGLPFVERRVGVAIPFPVRVAVDVAGCFLVGVVVAKAIEQPALALRDRLFPSKAK